MSLFYNFYKYPITVVIHEERANGMFVVIDKARRFREKTGESFYYLKRKKIKLPVQRFSNIYNGKKHILYLYSKGADEYQPMKVEMAHDKSTPIMRAKEEAVKFWQITAQKDARQRWRKESQLMKFMPIIAMVVFAIAVVIMINGFINVMAEMTKMSGQITKMVSQVAEHQLEITRIVNGVGQTTGVTTGAY